jgi:hypothetical protein
MSTLPTEADGRQALRDHLLEKAAAARAHHPDLSSGSAALALLNDSSVTRYPTGLRFDASVLRPGEFAWAMPLGEHPRDGFCVFVHPLFEHRPETWATILAYYIPPINYGEIATPEDCEAFGAALLGIDPETYYETLCTLADSVPGAGVDGRTR